MQWKNTVTVITGASSGIGKATLELLRNEGTLVYNRTPTSQKAS